MDQKYIRINNEVNEFLQGSLQTEKDLQAMGKTELADEIRRTSSMLADFVLNITGTRQALREFWNDKKTIAKNIN